MRVVLDTNILVSGFLWQGAAREIILAANRQRVSLFTSAALLEELTDVLGRGKFQTRLLAVDTTPHRLVSAYRVLATVVTPTPIPLTIIDDPDDDFVLACAVTASADRIVTNDNHLLKLKIYQGIPIIRPAAFLSQLNRPV